MPYARTRRAPARSSNKRRPATRTRAARAPARKTVRRRSTTRRASKRMSGSAGGWRASVARAGGKLLDTAVNSGASALVKAISGFGDYDVKENSLIHNRDAVPQFTNDGRVTKVAHREFVQDIQGSVFFNPGQFNINPANSDLFPWLSQVAANYEQYVVQGMIFEFKTTSGAALASNNTTLGTVVGAVQYNSLSQKFVNKQQMENYEFAQSTVPSSSMIIPVECDPSQTQVGGILNCRNPANSALNADPRLYDIGNFTIATVGMQSNLSTVGELWVSYEVVFLKPRLGGITNATDFYQLVSATNWNNASQPFGPGNIPIVPSKNNWGFTQIGRTSGIGHIYFDPSFIGVVQVTFQLVNSGAITAAVIQSPSLVIPTGSTGNFVDVTPELNPGGQNGGENGCLYTGTAGYTNAFSGTLTWSVYVKCLGGVQDSTGPQPGNQPEIRFQDGSNYAQ